MGRDRRAEAHRCDVFGGLRGARDGGKQFMIGRPVAVALLVDARDDRLERGHALAARGERRADRGGHD